MAVIDPVFQNFDYASALRQATSGIDRLGEGRLAISQQAGQRAFETARDQRLSDLSQKREAANETLRAAFQKQAETDRLNQQQKIHLTEVERQKEEGRKQLFSRAILANPSFRADPQMSDDDNETEANKAIKAKIIGSLSDIRSRKDALNAELYARYASAGKIPPPDEAQVAKVLAEDPALFGTLTPEERTGLRNGSIKASDLESKYLRTKNQAAIASAALDARTKLTEAQKPGIMASIMASDKEAQSRFDFLNQAESGIVNSADLKSHPEWLAEALPDTSKSSNAPSASLDKNGFIPPANSPSDNGVPAGTPTKNNPNYYAAIAGLHQETANHHDILAEKAALQDKLDKGGATVFVTSTGGPGRPPLNPIFEKYGVEKMGEIAKQFLKVQKAEEDSAGKLTGYTNTLKTIDPTFGTPQAQPQPVPQSVPPALPPLPQTPGSTVDFNNLPPNLFNQSNQVNQGIQSATAQPPMFPSPASQPSPMGGQQITLDPPDGTQPAPGGIPGAASAMQSMAIQNKINAAAGTSDPNALTRAKAYMHNQLQWDDQKVQSHIAGVIQGDPSAIQVFRAIVQRAQAGNSMSPPSVQPQPAFPTQPLQ